MLRTFNAPFDFHQPRGGRQQFQELATTLASRFASTPQVIDDPTFSYDAIGSSRLERVGRLDDSQPAIVYLSNIVMHSAILILGDCDTSDLQHPLQYDSLRTFVAKPYVRGYHTPRETPLRSSFDDTDIVISDLARFRDDKDELLDSGLFRVLERIRTSRALPSGRSDVFICNILDYDRYFADCSVCGDEPFFLRSDSGVDLKECVERLENETLREFLLDQSVPFATLGDDHMDDMFAVSYGMDCWRCGEHDLAFAR